MRKTLVMDPETREMRLRYEDYWNGQHEVTEYRVLSARVGGVVVRNRPDADGQTVHGTAPDLYLRTVDGWGKTLIWTEDTAIAPTVKTPCPKATNARRKCERCAAAAA